MKKLIVSLFLATAIIVTTCINAFAAVPTKDGVYVVPIQIRSAEDNSESEQNDFFYQSALLEVEDGKKYLTMAALSSMIGFQIYYYTDGSTTGSVQPAKIVKNIEINNRTYPSGYRIPVKGNSNLIGILFEIPYSSVSVSGRIYIDYDNCKVVSTPNPTYVPDSSNFELPTSSGGSSHTYDYPYALKQPTAQDNNENDYNYELSSSDETVSENTGFEENGSEVRESKVMTKIPERNNNTGVIIGGIVLGVVLIGLAVVVIMSKSKK